MAKIIVPKVADPSWEGDPLALDENIDEKWRQAAAKILGMDIPKANVAEKPAKPTKKELATRIKEFLGFDPDIPFLGMRRQK